MRQVRVVLLGDLVMVLVHVVNKYKLQATTKVTSVLCNAVHNAAVCVTPIEGGTKDVR